MALTWTHTWVLVEDMPRALSFYHDTLGLPIAFISTEECITLGYCRQRILRDTALLNSSRSTSSHARRLNDSPQRIFRSASLPLKMSAERCKPRASPDIPSG